MVLVPQRTSSPSVLQDITHDLRIEEIVLEPQRSSSPSVLQDVTDNLLFDEFTTDFGIEEPQRTPAPTWLDAFQSTDDDNLFENVTWDE